MRLLYVLICASDMEAGLVVVGRLAQREREREAVRDSNAHAASELPSKEKAWLSSSAAGLI